MPDAEVHPEPAPPPPPERRAPAPPIPARRWVDALTGLLLLGAASGTVVAAAPSILRQTHLSLPGLAPAEEEPRVYHRPSPREPLAEPPGVVEDDESPWGEPRVTELERLYPDAPWPGRRKPIAPGGDEAVPVEQMRLGKARQEVRLHDSPADASASAGALKKGDPVLVLKELGGWVFVMHGEDIKGWARKSELQIR